MTSKCVLCKKTYEGYGNNAEPLAKGMCCDPCNEIVIITRIELMGGGAIGIGLIKIDIGKLRYKIAQKIADGIFKKEYGSRVKADAWICHRIDKDFKFFEGTKKARCDHCGESICYDSEHEKKMKKSVKKICNVCVLKVKKYSKALTKDQRKIMEQAYGK